MSIFQRHCLAPSDFSSSFVFVSLLVITFLCSTAPLFFCPVPHFLQHEFAQGPQLPKNPALDLQHLISQRFFISSLSNFFFCKNMSIICLWSSALLSLYSNIFTLSLSHLIQGTILKMPTASQPFIVWNKSTFFLFCFYWLATLLEDTSVILSNFKNISVLIGSSTPSFCLWNYIIRPIYFCYCILFLDHFNPRHLAQICYIQCWILVQKGQITDMLTHMKTTWKVSFY